MQKLWSLKIRMCGKTGWTQTCRVPASAYGGKSKSLTGFINFLNFLVCLFVVESFGLTWHQMQIQVRPQRPEEFTILQQCGKSAGVMCGCDREKEKEQEMLCYFSCFSSVCNTFAKTWAGKTRMVEKLRDVSKQGELLLTSADNTLRVTPAFFLIIFAGSP